MLVLVACFVTAVALENVKHEDALLEDDYTDDIKEYAAHNAEEAAAKYTAQINKIDMLDDYPHDDDFLDHQDRGYDDDDDDDGDYDDDDDDDDRDDDEEDDDEDDDDDDDGNIGGGCGGGGRYDDDDDEEEELNPVQEVIEEYFTR